ncbi:MAG: hypothetical protein ABFD97_18260 [Syntrophobacter sp.]
MTKPKSKPKCVLLDANIIIEAYSQGVWEVLVDKLELVVSSIVAREEALFFVRGELPQAINLRKLISEGRVTEIAATSELMISINGYFDRNFIEGLHEGEAEALALVRAGSIGEALYCTGDAIAIQALAMLGHFEIGISMESLLKQAGLQKQLDIQFTEKFFRTNIGIGKENRITGRGLRGNVVIQAEKNEPRSSKF